MTGPEGGAPGGGVVSEPKGRPGESGVGWARTGEAWRRQSPTRESVRARRRGMNISTWLANPPEASREVRDRGRGRLTRLGESCHRRTCKTCGGRGAGFRSSGWVSSASLSFSGSAQGGPQDDDGAPSGTIAYFTGGACPAGWTTAANVQGRLVVAVADGSKAGMQVGTPLTDQEDRQHQHTYTGMATLASMSINGVDGSNNNGAAAQAFTVTGTTGMASSSLPFVQVQPCLKM